MAIWRTILRSFGLLSFALLTMPIDGSRALAAAQLGNASLPLVSPIFGDNMVLQRGKPDTIWGWSNPGESIRLEIADQTATATTGPDGRWQAQIQPPAPGGPYILKIDGSSSVELRNILVGDVWLCGGQSNMELPLSRTRNGEAEIKAADHPDIRFFIVHNHPSYSPAMVPEGAWKVCSPKTVAEGPSGGFSAVAYFFARKLQNELHVPIGLVEDCVGGTPVETWMSPATLGGLKDFDDQLAEIARLQSRGGPQYGNYIMHWYDDYDIGLKGKRWDAPDLDDSAWKTVQIPGGFRELGVPDVPCVCWFRKEITLPDPLPAGKATIFLGSIEKMDTTTINGQWVGASSWVENPRVYVIGDGILKPDRNVLTIRVFKLKPDGGFLAKPNALYLMLGDRSKVPLAGQWKGALSVDARPPHPLPLGFENYPTMPTVLFHGMIEPLAPLGLTGAIWYQGEANAERAYQYRTLLPAMIQDWRSLFAQGDFPFYIVSLPAFMHRRDNPGDDSWAELREAQALTAANVPNTGLAVTIDTGDPDSIHPKDKKVVGERLALCALAKNYGQKVLYEGPTFAFAEPLPGAIRLHFDHTDGGLVAKGDKLEEFSVAGADHQWHWAVAKLDVDTVIVSSPMVPDPKAARYAWQANPVATLFNGAGFPATPFRTDDWPGLTEAHKPS
ncbi:MAG: sialate O-acetylesterase [Tepidisphaeraceae bacterium]|jgi:sialate O-acetylesterase